MHQTPDQACTNSADWYADILSQSATEHGTTVSDEVAASQNTISLVP